MNREEKMDTFSLGSCEDLKKINVDENTPKGTILYASDKISERWLILVDRVVPLENGYKTIIRHVSYDISGKRFLCDKINFTTSTWGSTAAGYDFYIASKEQRKFIIDLMAKNGIKYVKVLNRMIKR